MKESKIERYVKTHLPPNYRLIKFTSPGESGVPDRILLMPEGKVMFIEFKTDTGKLSDRQWLWFNRLKELGHDVRVIAGMEMAKELVDEIASLSKTDG